MKNIHLLPTEKPSNLVLINNNLFLTTTKDFDSLVVKFQNIYITSSDSKEIKMDDWYLDDTNSVRQAITECESYWTHRKAYQKIILTTDPQLIADGIQAIDDDFLEWFVKNPTCEEIETKLIEFEVDMELGESCIEYGSYYKIIFPREQPYQELFDYLANELGVNALLTQMQEIETIVMAKQKQINYD